MFLHLEMTHPQEGLVLALVAPNYQGLTVTVRWADGALSHTHRLDRPQALAYVAQLQEHLREAGYRLTRYDGPHDPQGDGPQGAALVALVYDYGRF